MDTEASRMDQVRTGLPPHRWTKVEEPEGEAIVTSNRTVIAGGGPAGLTAALELTKHGQPCVVLEADPALVGGISRTDQYRGYRFDIGGHRFFSKSDEVNAIWREILGDQLITRSRMSRIYYDRKF
ncbi:MAG: NAD(P)-binding protein, partial [Planctomycetaceae bacterium]|nr:NAD(P)-binding protein [Planctomycetaceae bacterium]